MVHDVIVALAGLAVAGQVIVALAVLVGLLALVGVRGPLESVRGWLWGYELWGGFVVASIATGGSLFFSEIAGYIPCDLCWFQRVTMYPLSILLLFLAWHRDNRAARYLLILPVVGAGTSIYHILVENHWVSTPQACQIGAGCTVKWINEFGYITIPTLALTAFLLLIGFLVLASTGTDESAATLPAEAER